MAKKVTVKKSKRGPHYYVRVGGRTVAAPTSKKKADQLAAKAREYERRVDLAEASNKRTDRAIKAAEKKYGKRSEKYHQIMMAEQKKHRKEIDKLGGYEYFG